MRIAKRLYLKCLLPGLVAFIATAKADSNLLQLKLTRAFDQLQYVHTLQDFREHFQLHIERVRRIGLEAYDRYPEFFSGIPRDDVEHFLKLHDQAKINETLQFKKQFWVEPPESATFLERLWHKYNVNINVLPEDEKKIAFADIAKLNAVDKAVGMKFLTEKGYLDSSTGEPNALGKKLLRIERIADVTDRNTDPVAMEELALKEQVPVSIFIKDPDDLRMIDELKRDYEKIVRGARYSDRCSSWLLK